MDRYTKSFKDFMDKEDTLQAEIDKKESKRAALEAEIEIEKEKLKRHKLEDLRQRNKALEEMSTGNEDDKSEDKPHPAAYFAKGMWGAFWGIVIFVGVFLVAALKGV